MHAILKMHITYNKHKERKSQFVYCINLAYTLVMILLGVTR